MSKTIRGIRDFIAGNTIIGRLGQSSGPPGPISITDLLRSDVAKAVVSNVTPANPTATAADTAVNGSANTFMRSDAAPAVQKCSSSAFGLCKVDNSTITASGGVITAHLSGAGNGLYAPSLSAIPTMAGTGLSTWLNQGTATETDSSVGMALAPGGTDPAGASLRVLYKASPSTPYTVTALVAAQSLTANSNAVGIGWTDGTKLHTLALVNLSTTGPYYLECQKWTNTTTFSAFNATGAKYIPSLAWLQLKDDGTNVTFSYSIDGANFIQVFTVAKASGFLGASGYSHVCFFINSQGTGMIGTLMSYTD